MNGKGMLMVATSVNGWSVVGSQETHPWKVNGAIPPVRLRKGPGGFVLAHFLLWYAEEVERVQGQVLDDWGWCPPRPIRGGTSMSNHCSGTALDINAQAHPLGGRDTHTQRQEWDILRRLKGKYCGGITWGGTWEHRPDPMHFEVTHDYPFTRALARRLAGTERGSRIRRANPGVPFA